MNVDPANPKNPERDRFVLSKGHCVEALYVTLEAKGFVKPEIIDTLGQFGSILSGHPTIEVPGIEVNSGALGHGLSIGVGMGDGEQGEGSIYEAAMAANQYHLDNLVAIIDRNRLQISGCTEDVMSLENIRERWSSFGWDVHDVDGDDIADIVKVMGSLDFSCGKPHLIISHTTKGKGISYMENVAKWHHGVPSAEQYEQGMNEIEKRIEELEAEIEKEAL